jgi:hypothetical protein
MRTGETDPTLRRVFFELFLDDGVTPTTDADVAAPAGTIQVTSNGIAFANGAGTFARITSNLYYYEFTLTEALGGASGFVGIKFSRTGYHSDIFTEIVGNIFTVGATDLGKLRYPVLIYGTGVEPQVPTAGATVTTPSDLQVSYNGGAFTNSAGSLVEVGAGLYYFQGTATDAAVRRRLIAKYESTGFAPAVLSIDVDVPGVSSGTTSTGPAPIPVLPATDSGFTPLDHVTNALNRLPHQYRGDGVTLSRTQVMLKILTEPLNDLETTAVAVLTGLDIEHAVGAQLDLVGKKVGRAREGIADDEIYRRYCRAQVSTNKSDGIIGDVLTVARLVLGAIGGYTLTLNNQGAAAYLLEVGGAALDATVVQVLSRLITKATSAGVRPILVWSESAPADTFRFDSGPGFDVGHLAGATDHAL